MAEVYLDGQIVNAVLNELNWPVDKRSIDMTLGASFPKWWEDVTGLDILYDLELITLGFFYVDRYGYAVWEGRSFRAMEKTEVDFVFADDMVDLEYELHDRDIYNDIIITAEYLDTETTTTTTDQPVIRTAGASATVTAAWGWDPGSYSIQTVKSEHPAISWHSPAIGYVGGNASKYLFSATIISKDASSCTLKIQYNGSTVILGSCPVRASVQYDYWTTAPVSETTTEEVTIETEHEAEDPDSQAKYGKRTKRIDMPFKMDAQALAENLVKFYLNYYKEPVARITMTVVGSTDELLAAILSLSISSRITVANSKLGMSADFYINKEAHTIRPDKLHEATYDLIKVYNVTGNEHGGIWVLNMSQLGINTILDWGGLAGVPTAGGWYAPENWESYEVVGKPKLGAQLSANIRYFSKLPLDFCITGKSFTFKSKTPGTLNES